MSEIHRRLRNLERRIKEQPCPLCKARVNLHIISEQTLMPAEWFTCPRCGAKLFPQLFVMGKTDEDARRVEARL